MEPLDPKAELMRLADEWAKMRVSEPFRHLAQTDAAVKFAVEQEARYRDVLSAAITLALAAERRRALETAAELADTWVWYEDKREGDPSLQNKSIAIAIRAIIDGKAGGT